MICEECKKEFDGTTRFCSKSCRCKHNGRMSNKNGKLNGHKQHNTGITCWKAKPEGWLCCWCNQHFRTKILLQEHKHNEHSDMCSSGHVWNKGLTKETCERVKLNAEHVSKAMRESAACKYDHAAIWTEERRREQSERMKKLYAEHPEKHPNAKLAGNHAKLTYPEQLAHDWLVEHGYEPIHNWHYKSDKINRYVDFYVESLNLIIEIDGEYWHADATQDKAKDEDARAHGFATLRVKPKEGVVKQLETYFS